MKWSRETKFQMWALDHGWQFLAVLVAPSLMVVAIGIGFEEGIDMKRWLILIGIFLAVAVGLYFWISRTFSSPGN